MSSISSSEVHTIYLSLGTNLGERLSNLKTARSALHPQVIIECCSKIYETPPWGFTAQATFYNQVIKGKTSLSPLELLKFLKKVEVEIGRLPSFKNGPRLIDIDILFYDQLILETDLVTIPHPRIEGRAFIWLPLADIAPDFIHPILNRSAREIMSELDLSGIEFIASDCDNSQSSSDHYYDTHIHE